MTRHSPSWAERARTSLSEAAVATLVVPLPPDACTSTIVTIEAQLAGQPRVWLEPSSPVISMLTGSAVATVVIPGPLPFRCLALGGPLQRQPPDQSGCQPYDVSLRFVRLLGAATRHVSVTAFVEARPDPLRFRSSAALQHLDSAHREDLLACVRAHGHGDVVSVMPRALDRYGLEIAAITDDGVRSIRMNYRQGAITRLEDVDSQLRAFLACRCHHPWST